MSSAHDRPPGEGVTVVDETNRVDWSLPPRFEFGRGSHAEAYSLITQFTSDYAYAYRVDPDGRLVFEVLSENYLRATGFSVADLRQRRLEDLVHPDDLEAALAHVTRLLSGQPDEAEYRLMTKSGGVCWIRDNAHPVFADGQKRVVRVVGVQEDVTERKRAEAALRESEERFRNIFDHAPIGMAVVGLDRRPLMVNHALCNMLGYSEQELLSKFLGDVVHPDDLRVSEGFIERLGAGEIDNWSFEGRYLHGSGSVGEALVSASLVRDGRGSPLYAICQVLDITESKKAERRLRESEDRFRNIFDHAPIGMAVVGLDRRPLTVNRALCDMLGYSEQELLSKAFGDLAHPDDVQAAEAQIDRLVAGEIISWQSEGRFFHKSGRLGKALLSLLLVRDGSDSSLYAICQVLDITENEKAVTRLRENEHRLRMVLEQNPAVLWTTDRELKITSSVGSGLRNVGFEAHALVGTSLFDYFQTSDVEFTPIARHLAALRGDSILFVQALAGRVFQSQLEPLCSEDGEIIGTIGAGADITELKRIEEELRKSEEQFRSVFEANPVGMLIVDSDLRLVSVNDALCRMLQYRREEMVGRLATDFLAPDEVESSLQHVSAARAGVLSGYQIERHYVRKDGQSVLVNGTAAVVHDEQGRPVRGIAMIEDITIRRQAEDALRQSEQRFRSIFEQSPLGIVIGDASYRLTRVNPAFCRMLGYCAEELVGRRYTELIHPDDVDIALSLADTAFGGEGRGYRAERRFIRSDGQVVLTNLAVTIVNEEATGTPIAIAVIEDVTERKRAEREAREREEALAHALRVSAVGEMAAGMAHELSQPLTAMVNYARGCVHRMNSGTADLANIRHAVEQVTTQGLRAGEIVRRYRDFLRKEGPGRKPADVNALVQQAVSFVKASLPAAMGEIRLQLAPFLPAVIVDGIQIEQVIVNLVRNGLEAGEDHGDNEVWVRTDMVPQAIEVAVEDKGRGLAPAIRERIFEAFVTSKPGGFGMGLAISRSIVEAHGGQIWATPNLSRGTTFRFTLPLPDESER